MRGRWKRRCGRRPWRWILKSATTGDTGGHRGKPSRALLGRTAEGGCPHMGGGGLRGRCKGDQKLHFSPKDARNGADGEKKRSELRSADGQECPPPHRLS